MESGIYLAPREAAESEQRADERNALDPYMRASRRGAHTVTLLFKRVYPEASKRPRS